MVPGDNMVLSVQEEDTAALKCNPVGYHHVELYRYKD